MMGGAFSLNGLGTYSLNGWGSYEKVGWCFVWKYAQKMLVIRGVPLLITWPEVSIPLNFRFVAYYREGGTTPHLRLVLIWGVQLPVTLTLELSPYCEARSHLSYHCEAHSQFTLAEVVRLTHIYITSVRLTHTYIKVMVYILFMTFNCACAQMILYVTFNCTCARMIPYGLRTDEISAVNYVFFLNQK